MQLPVPAAACAAGFAVTLRSPRVVLPRAACEVEGRRSERRLPRWGPRGFGGRHSRGTATKRRNAGPLWTCAARCEGMHSCRALHRQPWLRSRSRTVCMRPRGCMLWCHVVLTTLSLCTLRNTGQPAGANRGHVSVAVRAGAVRGAGGPHHSHCKRRPKVCVPVGRASIDQQVQVSSRRQSWLMYRMSRHVCRVQWAAD